MKEKIFKKGIAKRLFSVVLTMAMVLSLMPSTKVMAATGDWSKLNTALNSGSPTTVDGVFEVSSDAEATTIKLLTDITALDGESGLSVASGKKIILDLNGHTLDRGLASKSASYNGYAIYVNSSATLTVRDTSATGTPGLDYIAGSITGGNNSSAGGGVRCGGIFILESGIITGNSSNSYGGGIYGFNSSSGSINIRGGEISYNVSNCPSYGGGGICSDSFLNLSGGAIFGNVATKKWGGGVYVDIGNFSVTGGKIFDNQSTSLGGGFIATRISSGTVGGPFEIYGNTDTSGNASNFHLGSGYLTVDANNKFGDATKINVFSSGSGDVLIARGASQADIKHFASDHLNATGIVFCNGSKDYDVNGNEISCSHYHSANTIWLTPKAAHTHEWQYSATDNKIEAYCSKEGCPSGTSSTNKVALTLTTSSANDSGSAATINVGTEEEKVAWRNAGLTVPTTISYTKANGEPLASAPTEDGIYVVKVTVGGVTAQTLFTIGQAYEKVSEDTLSTYAPTEIVNGDFSVAPWMSFTYGGVTYSRYENRNSKIYIKSPATNITPNGVGQGWNTTETTLYLGSLFEWSGTPSTYNHFLGGTSPTNVYREDGTKRNFVDMNSNNAGVLYQDLATQGGDIIRWTLAHAPSPAGDDPQAMHVDIGAPNGNPAGTDSKIKADSLGQYMPTGITSGSGSVAFANGDELANLSVAKRESSNPTTAFKFCAGVYIVPAGQSVTRFAFVSDAPTPTVGNLLSDLTFSTLIGNLHATLQDGGDVKVTGYWGDTDNSKKLMVKIGDTVNEMDMSTVLNKNFSFVIPADKIGNSASVEIYHQDYENAKKTVRIEHEHRWTYTVGTGESANKVIAKCSGYGECSITNGKTDGVELTVNVSDKTITGEPIGATVTWPVNDSSLATPTIKYVGRGTTTYAESSEAPSAAGKYTAKISIGGLEITRDFEITKKNGPAAPNSSSWTATAVTKIGAKDGSLSGVNSLMEYSTDGGSTWTKVTGSTITGLGAGSVLVRYAATDDTNPGDYVTVSVPNHVHSYGSEGASRYTCRCGYIDYEKKSEAEAADHLKDVKATAKAKIDREVGSDTSPNVLKAAEDAKKAIDSATDVHAVSHEESKGIAAVAEAKGKNALAEAKLIAKAEIDEAVGQDTSKAVKEAADAAKTAIDDATTVDDVATAKDDGIDAIEAAKAALAEAKRLAEEAIAEEVGLDISANVKKAADDAKKAIDEATSIDAVTAAENEGIEKIKAAKAANALAEAKRVAKAAIDREVGSDTSANVKKAAEDAKKAIDEASDIHAVSHEESKGIAAIATAKGLNALAEAKHVAKTEVDNEVGFDTSANVKKAEEDAKKAIDEAADVDAVATAKDEGIERIRAAKAANALAEAKKAAKDAIDKEVGSDATVSVKEAADAAKRAIDAATDIHAVSHAEFAGIAAIATAKGINALTEAKNVARTEIDEAVGQDAEPTVLKAAEDAKKAIDEASSVDEVATIKENGIEAIEAAKEVIVLDTAKKAAEEAVTNRVGSDTSANVKKAEEAAKKAIKEATTVDEVKTAKENGIKAIAEAKALEEAKWAAKAAIDREAGLDTSANVKKAVEAAKKAIDAATDVHEVSHEESKGIAAVAAAKGANVLAEAKKIAKLEITEEVGLDTSANVKKAAEDARKAIDAATNADDVATAKDAGIEHIRAAKAANVLAETKKLAKEAIDKEVGTDTSDTVREAAEEAKKAIDEATDVHEVSHAEFVGIASIATAKGINALEEAKKIAKEEIDEVVGSDTSDNVKNAAEAAKNAIDQATTIDEVEEAMDAGIEDIQAEKAINAGKIENTTDPEENSCSADVELNRAEIIEKFELSDEELTKVENGVNISVKLEVKAEKHENITKAEKEATEKKLESGEKIGQYLDINLFKIVGDNKSKVTETNGLIEIQITLPNEIKNAGTDYFIIRVHDGVATRLELKHISGDTYEFETDRFSTYSIGYKAKAAADDTDNSKVEAPKTGDPNDLKAWVLVFITVLGGAVTVVGFKRKEKFSK